VESIKPSSHEVNEGGAVSGPAGSPNLLAALAYAERGWHVLPCWWVTTEGQCACSKPNCQNPGKHPLGKLAPEGLLNASTEEAIIRGWWTTAPDANIGVVTGSDTGLAVLDIDPRHGGDESLKRLTILGNLPLTTQVHTGGGGLHIYLRHPGYELKIKSRPLPGYPGVDIKADGGYVIVPPSNHVSGGTYLWKVSPESYSPAKIPDWLLTLLLAEPQSRRTPSEGANHGEKIPQGNRNIALASLAGTMRRRGMSLEAIEAALLAENKKCDPPLTESEVLAIAKSVSKYAPGGNGTASGSDWPEPEPLRRSPEPGEPFPLEALGSTLGEAATAINAVVKAPAAICGQAVLASANLAVQGFVNVQIDGRRFPISEFFLSVAVSGDRKSAADRAALAPVDAREKELMTAYKQDLAMYEKETLLWKKDRDAALKKPKDRREALEALPPPPTPPYYPQLTTEEPTYEGLAKLLAHGHPSVGLFSDEAGRFFGGFAMNQENRLKTLAGLSALWDGRPVTRTRAGEGASTLYGRRVCAHFLMQPLVAETVLSDPLAHDQGFLSRCLIVEPKSTLGTQSYVAQDLSRDPRYGRYCARLTSILQARLPLKIDPETGSPANELVPRNLPVSPDGKEVWIRFHDWVQDHLREGGIFRPISGIAAKAAEHALRLAGTIALFENIDAASIPLEHLKAGIVLARFFLTEALRLFHSAKTNPDLLLAEKVLSWFKTRTGSRPQLVSLPCVYRNGPNAVRDKSTAARCMAILTDHGWTRSLEGGAEIDGKKRRQVWEVHPDV
jgi:hypothetical protein